MHIRPGSLRVHGRSDDVMFMMMIRVWIWIVAGEEIKTGEEFATKLVLLRIRGLVREKVDRIFGIQGKISQSSFRGRKERNLGFRRDGDREEYKGLGKREDLLEEESSDEDVKSLVMGGIGDLLSEEDEEEDEEYDFLKKKAAPAFGFDVKTSDSYLTKTRFEEGGHMRWARVTDLEDGVVFLGTNWNFCYSIKEVPYVKGNWIIFIQPNTIRERMLVFDLRTRKTT